MFDKAATDTTQKKQSQQGKQPKFIIKSFFKGTKSISKILERLIIAELNQETKMQISS